MTDIPSLEAELREKEQLVAALTERLEQAAEQLDRIHRSGGARGARTAGLPSELVESQQGLVNDLQQAVQQWDEMQPGAALGRIEIQITELRDFIAGNLTGGSSAALQMAGHIPANVPASPNNSSTTAEPAAGGNNSGESGPLAGSYEALKAGLLDSSLDESQPKQPADSTIDTGVDSTVETPIDVSPPSLVEFEQLNLLDPPELFDPETADIEQLRHGIEARDIYISHLILRLRTAESRQNTPIDWESIQNVPDEFGTRLKQLEARLEETLRLAEVDLSLERARLGRESARLEQLADQVERKAKKFDNGSDGGGNAEESAGSDDGMGGRWQRLFGVRKSGDSSREE